jgi:hypothetical protein
MVSVTVAREVHMRRLLTPWLRAAGAVGFIALLVGCGSSSSSKATSTTVNRLQVQLVAFRHAATDLLDACLHGDTPHLLPHVETHLRAAQWANACKALRDHHAQLVSAQANVHGSTATVHVRLRTHDSHPRDFDETWHLGYHGSNGWQLSAMPAVMVGAWDHHDDHLGTTVHHVETDH